MGTNQLENKSRRLLVVDDDDTNRMLVGKALEYEGYQVKLAESGADALKVLNDWHPHMVLLDVNMPGLNGLETLAKLHARDEYVSVIFVSANKAAGWEAQPASLEYEGVFATHVAEPTGERSPSASVQTLDVSPLLSVEEVRGVTGFAGEFEVGRMADRVRSDVFDSRHFKAKGKTEAFDVGVRVWAVGPAAAEEQFRKLMGELPAAVATEEIGDRSLRARGGDVLGLAFLLRERGLLIQLSCGTSQCTEPGMVLRLAKLVESHVGELSAATEGKTPTEANPPSGKTPEGTRGKP